MLRFFKLSILLNKMGSLDLRNRAVFRSKIMYSHATRTGLAPSTNLPAILFAVPSRHPLFSEGWLYALTIYPPHCVTHEKGISRPSCSMAATVFTRLLASRPLSQAYYCMTRESEKLLNPPNLGSPFY
jgi:hypothetical protein